MDSNTCKAIACTVSGTTITAGTKQAVPSSDEQVYDTSSSYDVENSIGLVAWDRDQSSAKLNCATISLSGTGNRTITFNSVLEVYSGTNIITKGSLTYDPVSKKHLLAYTYSPYSNVYGVVLTVSGTNAGDGAIYVNGSRDDDGASTVFMNAGDFVIGKNPNASNRYFNGKITQVAIYNKVLTSTEVSGIYNLGRHGNLLDSYSDNLKGYWVMGGLDSKTGLSDTDSTIYDRSGNSNHGTTSGTATGDLKSPPNAEPNGYAKGDTNRSTTTP